VIETHPRGVAGVFHAHVKLKPLGLGSSRVAMPFRRRHQMPFRLRRSATSEQRAPSWSERPYCFNRQRVFRKRSTAFPSPRNPMRGADPPRDAEACPSASRAALTSWLLPLPRLGSLLRNRCSRAAASGSGPLRFLGAGPRPLPDCCAATRLPRRRHRGSATRYPRLRALGEPCLGLVLSNLQPGLIVLLPARIELTDRSMKRRRAESASRRRRVETGRVWCLLGTAITTDMLFSDRWLD